MPAAAVGKSGLSHRLRVVIGPYHPLMRWYRQHRPGWVWKRLHRIGRVATRFVAENGLVVRRGPFEGLRYVDSALGHTNLIAAKLLGSYEPKVVEAVASMADEIDVFVDIGAAEGYFCIGMARRNPALRVIGFETTQEDRELCARMAVANGVSLDLRGTADHAAIQALPDGRTLLLVDVEGFEAVLLDPERAPRLREVAMVVELHEPDHPGIRELLSARFAATHHVELLVADPDDRTLYPELEGWSDIDAALAMTDGRGYLGEWLVLRPR